MNNLRIQKWGNSQGIRLPKELLKQSSLSVGDSLECNIEADKIILKPISGRRKYDLAQLLSDVPENFKNSEYDFGEPMGGEV